VDGVHFNIRLDDDRLCTLVMIGARADEQKAAHPLSNYPFKPMLFDHAHEPLNRHVEWFGDYPDVTPMPPVDVPHLREGPGSCGKTGEWAVALAAA
jgi:hypothetical protein